MEAPALFQSGGKNMKSKLFICLVGIVVLLNLPAAAAGTPIRDSFDFSTAELDASVWSLTDSAVIRDGVLKWSG